MQLTVKLNKLISLVYFIYFSGRLVFSFEQILIGELVLISQLETHSKVCL